MKPKLLMDYAIYRAGRELRSPSGGFVYALIDPRDPARIRYVGATVNPLVRWQTHVWGSATKVRRWVAGLRAEGVWPSMILLARPNYGLLDVAERQFIAEMRSRGMADLNRPAGGRPRPATARRPHPPARNMSPKPEAATGLLARQSGNPDQCSRR